MWHNYNQCVVRGSGGGGPLRVTAWGWCHDTGSSLMAKFRDVAKGRVWGSYKKTPSQASNKRARRPPPPQVVHFNSVHDLLSSFCLFPPRDERDRRGAAVRALHNQLEASMMQWRQHILSRQLETMAAAEARQEQYLQSRANRIYAERSSRHIHHHHLLQQWVTPTRRWRAMLTTRHSQTISCYH